MAKIRIVDNPINRYVCDIILKGLQGSAKRS
jgi:hypothetical protein